MLNMDSKDIEKLIFVILIFIAVLIVLFPLGLWNMYLDMFWR